MTKPAVPSALEVANWFFKRAEKSGIYLEEDKWLISIIIKDEFRKRGYAKKALSLLFEECKAHGIKEIHDKIAVDNPSIDLFLDLGFTIIDRNDEYILIKTALD